MVAHATGCMVIQANRVGVVVLEPNKLVHIVGFLVGLQGSHADGHDFLLKARAMPSLEPLLESKLDVTTNLEG
jgi:hypothetical protein